MSEINLQLKERHISKMASLYKFSQETMDTIGHQVITSSDDTGVQRNGGKLGSRFAPKTILNELGKLEVPDNPLPILVNEVTPKRHKKSFVNSQIYQTEKIKDLLSRKLNSIVHIGGGHDHILPLLNAIDQSRNKKKILVVNIDAHTDTRIDKLPHSGTPFRQFGESSKNKFELIQLGVRRPTNNERNFDPISNTEMHCLPFFEEDDLVRATELINKLNDKNTELVLSIDCDGIDLRDIPAVSAPNPFGTPFPLLLRLLSILRPSFNILGVYELNPLLDNHSNNSSKKVAWIINDFLLGV
jgi:formiminoglutamase